MRYKSLLLPFFVSLFFLLSITTFAQNGYSLQLSKKWNSSLLYENDSLNHITWKPVLYTDTLVGKHPGTWLNRKFFNEHLLQVEKENFNIYGDLIFDEYIGKSKRFVETPMMNTRGFEISGNVGKKFYFETGLYENQGRFPGYVDSFIRKSRIIPGQAKFKNIGDGKGFDFSYSTARLIYTPNRHLLFDLGYNKNFIGDGYRSLMLSEFSTNYPYLRTSLTYGKFQYSFMWSQYLSGRDGSIYALGFPRKWSQTFLIDYKATNNLTVSLFESVIWPDEDSLRNKDISPSLLSPVMFLHGNKTPSGASNNEIVGLNLKYKILPRTYIYSQYVVDQFAKGGSWKNKYGFQAGIRSSDVFNVSKLNGLIEFNTVRPYMYAADGLAAVYSNDRAPLAHPLGANFKEVIFVSDYSYKKWWFRLEAFAAKYGIDSSASANYGHDILKPLSTHSVEDNVKTGQGLSTKLYYVDLRAAYIINPLSNLRIEAGVVARNEKNERKDFKDLYMYIGVRMSFRSLYYDF
ncbi:MAG: hypothetical protein ACTHJ5_18055 [Ilyomonas sp.]